MRKYGWVKDKNDERDLLFSSFEPLNLILPDSTDLRAKCPPVYDQGELGSCTANALSGNIEFIHGGVMPSRLFIYYNERSIEHNVDTDSGAQIRDGIKSLVKYSVCPEVIWPYNVSEFTNKPSPQCYSEAKQDIVKTYLRLSNSLKQLKTCLANGFPFVFGITVYESFEADDVSKSGIIPMPKPDEECLGGHAIMCVGYDDEKKMFLVRNSWGDSWGIGGYCWMPYDYLSSPELASDFWTIRG